jgi:hypothetical protein
MEWEEDLTHGLQDSSDLAGTPGKSGAAQTPSELEHMLVWDSPGAVECFNAMEQATQAIAETAVQEAREILSAPHFSGAAMPETIPSAAALKTMGVSGS